MISLLLILFSFYFVWESFQDPVETFMLGSLFSIILHLFLCLILNIFDIGFTESRNNHSTPIYSLNNSQSIQGSFFLGTGHIQQTENYFMFTKDERGGYSRVTIPVQNASLFLGTQTPELKWQEINYVVSGWVSFIPFSRTERTKYDIFVPENTIIQKFEVK